MIRVTLALDVVRALELFCRARTSELDAGVALRRQNVGFTIRVCWGRRKGAVMISARVHYACLAMLELASHPSGIPLSHYERSPTAMEYPDLFSFRFFGHSAPQDGFKV